MNSAQNNPPFTQNELSRYSRHLLLPEIGPSGQMKLKNAKVLIVGMGGLGSPVAIYLAAAGVGTLGLVDFDKVDLSNLHRQVIHFSDDVGKAKVISAQEKIHQLNPEVKILTFETKLNSKNALEIFKNFDLIIDGTDNFPARYLINDACVLLKKPYVFGGILRFEGQCSVFGLNDGPCYRCLFQDPPKAGEVPSCAEAGVVGVLPGIVGLLQANEAIKIICEIGQSLKGRLLIFDALETTFREIKIKKDPQCAVCSPSRTIHQLEDIQLSCANTTVSEISVRELRNIMQKKDENFCLVDVREQDEWDIAHIDGAILKPMSSFAQNYQDLPKNKKIFLHCHLGGRSFQAAQFLKSKGFSEVFNVSGGIEAWSREIDPSVERY